MRFEDATDVEMLCWQMRMADYPRSQNRARINDLFNGVPPYTEAERQENDIKINVNFLEPTCLGHDARSQHHTAILKPGQFFKCVTDAGPVHKRAERASVVTAEIAKRMTRSLAYFECLRGNIAQDVLHGIGISAWRNDFEWCPRDIGVDDVMMPANIYLTEIARGEVPFFAIYRSLKAPELIRLARKSKIERGWNRRLIEQCLEWLDRETSALMGTNWPSVWSPEKASERIKGDGGLFVGDQVPTIDVWDFFFWNDEDDREGWCRRIIIDAWSTPTVTGQGAVSQPNPALDFARGQFLYTSGKRKIARSMSELISFEFADLSAVAPFQYHSVRSLGFLLYSVCHLQNRLRCQFNESVFESLMMYFRVRDAEDVARALKVELKHRGFIDQTIQFVGRDERHQIDPGLARLALAENANLIERHASSMRTPTDFSKDNVEKTKFQVMAELNTATILVSTALQQAYRYRKQQYQEIFRRFCNPRSRDPDVLSFRAACLRQGVPDRMLNPECWDIEPERIMGAGNKAMELAIAQQLMMYRPLYDPDGQREILNRVTLAITDDADFTRMVVPRTPVKVTDSIHDAELTAAALMMGIGVSVKQGVNHQEYIETLITAMANQIEKINARNGVATPDELMGLQNLAMHIQQHMQILGENPAEKDRVRQYGQGLARLINVVRAFAQRLAQQRRAGGDGQISAKDAETMSKIRAQEIIARAKAANLRESHAQRTAQRQIQFELKQQQERQKHLQTLQQELERHGMQIASERLRALEETYEEPTIPTPEDLSETD